MERLISAAAFTEVREAAETIAGVAINRVVSNAIDAEEEDDGLDRSWRAPSDVRNKYAPPRITITPSEAYQRSMEGKLKLTPRRGVLAENQWKPSLNKEFMWQAQGDKSKGFPSAWYADGGYDQPSDDDK